MRSEFWRLLGRYRGVLLAMVILAIIGLHPMLLAPMGRVYILLCERLAASAPVGHHYPPLLVALVIPVLAFLLVGGIVSGIREAFKQRRLAATLRARRWQPGEAEGEIPSSLHRVSDVLITRDEAVFAFCGGLIRPRVYVSRGVLALLDEEELDALIRHERHHARRRDPLRFFLTGLLGALAPVLPALWALDQWVRVRAELAADRAALASQPPEVLASTMVKVMRAVSVTNSERAPAVAALSPNEARIAALLGKPVMLKIDRADVALSSLVVVAFMMLTAWLALQSLPQPPPCSACPGF